MHAPTERKRIWWRVWRETWSGMTIRRTCAGARAIYRQSGRTNRHSRFAACRNAKHRPGQHPVAGAQLLRESGFFCFRPYLSPEERGNAG